MRTNQMLSGFWTTVLAVTTLTAAADSASVIPKPLPEPPSSWRMTDYDGHVLAKINAPDALVSMGRLPVGFYRLDSMTTSNWISVGVISPLQAPTPASSPIGIDVAMAWFYPESKMDAVANLCAVAGINWVRDRLTWGQMEPQRGEFSAPNRYDASARAQSQAGLRALQVMHLSPPWANPNGKRFPLDLRDAYCFYEAMARRWAGQVQAFEPWNEADIPMFGGHTGAEMGALQKAAYLGLKAGNPQVVACLNVFAMHNRDQLADLDANEAWPYFDTFNLHHYAPFDEYPKLYADFRNVSAGKPLWVSECSLPVKWAGDPKLKEPSDSDLKVQAERVAKTFACSLHEGSAATFYFLLPHYVEGQTQFGLLRPDLTPRPAYVALAAAGRLLADAQPLGRVSTSNQGVRAYLFRAKPDGHATEVLVAWSTDAGTSLTLPTEPVRVLDHLGRELAGANQLSLSSAPVFALLPTGSSQKLSLTPPPMPPPLREGKPCRVVLQALWPEGKLDLKHSAYVLSNESETIPVYAYNFGSTPVRGTLKVTPPDGWKASMPAEFDLAPQERKQLSLEVRSSESARPALGSLRVAGDCGDAGKPVLSIRVVRRD